VAPGLIRLDAFLKPGPDRHIDATIGGRLSGRMSWLIPTWVQCRAAIGVVALYALMLQPFLAAASPVAAPDPFGVICAADHGADAPSGDTASHHVHQCCTAAHIGGMAPPPDRIVGTITWPARSVSTIPWRYEAWIASTGPPTYASSARGPPLV
jgi:hypothetical protein